MYQKPVPGGLGGGKAQWRRLLGRDAQGRADGPNGRNEMLKLMLATSAIVLALAAPARADFWSDAGAKFQDVTLHGVTGQETADQ